MTRHWIARANALRPRQVLALMLGLFALVHLGYFLAGVRFLLAPLFWYPHYLDVSLLQHRLAQSVFYLHSQPPLFNLFLGLVLKLFPRHAAAAFAAACVLMALGLYFALYALMRRLGVPVLIALLLSTWFMASPAFLLYEQWLYYTLPLALLMTLSCLLFSYSLERPRFWPAFGLFAAILAMCTIHGSFHLLYFLLVMAGLLVLRWRHRRVIALAALLPLLLLVGLYAKNYVLFGQFATSSWLGLNFARATVKAVPLETRRQLVSDGKLSPLALIRPFANLDFYPARYTHVHGFGNIPALRQTRRPSLESNFNNLAYISISRLYLKDDFYVVVHQPKYALVGWLNSWICYFRSGSDYPPTYGNLSKITLVNVLYDYVFYGKVPRYHLSLGAIPIYYPGIYAQPRLYLFLLIGLPLLLVFGLRTALRPSRTGLPLTREQRVLVLYFCLNILFVALVGNAFETGENHRARFTTDPLDIALLGLVLQQLAWRRAVRRAPAEPAPVCEPSRT